MLRGTRQRITAAPRVRPQRLARALLIGAGLALALALPVGLGLWYIKLRDAGLTWQQSVAGALGTVLFVTAWFVLEGATDIADEAAEPNVKEGTGLLSARVRPLAILTFFLVLGLGAGVALVAYYLLQRAT